MRAETSEPKEAEKPQLARILSKETIIININVKKEYFLCS